MRPFHSSGDHYLVITERQVQSPSNTCGFVISNSSEVCFFSFFVFPACHSIIASYVFIITYICDTPGQLIHFHCLSTKLAWVLSLSWYLAERGGEEINFQSPCQGALYPVNLSFYRPRAVLDMVVWGGTLSM